MYSKRSKSMKKSLERDSLKERFAEATRMPKDVVLGASVLTIIGTGELYIENYRGIIEYTDVLVRIQAKGIKIKVQGKNLQIEYYTNDEMKIVGNIQALEYSK
ncbi:MAG: YabP/YqfC family sporulation protein [Candidatus Ruminococcus intestinipullorum]|nr:YabP/YqfC family sporulation protein [Candidatus Ruminococcus intestinipullorum]